VFIVGSARSGTTLLQSMLMQIPGLCFPPETQFFGRSLRRERVYGPLASPRGFPLHLEAVLESCRHNELPVDQEALRRELTEAERDFAAWFDVLLEHIRCRMPDCRRIGEKSPNHLLHVDLLLERFPDAQCITVVRDGRDVAVSQREAFGEPLLSSAIRWRLYQKRHRGYLRRWPPERYTWVRYEDLVTEPRRELERLCQFLGEEFRPEMLQQHRRRETGFASRETHKRRTLEPVTDSRISRFRQRLTSREIALWQLVAGRELVRHGYTLEPVRDPRCVWDLVRGLPPVLWRRERFFRSLVRGRSAR